MNIKQPRFAMRVVLLVGLLSSSCLTEATLRWMEEEVAVIGSTTDQAADHHVLFGVKNIGGVGEGLNVFDVTIPANWVWRARTETSAGLVELRDLLPYSSASFHGEPVDVRSTVVALTQKTCRLPPPALMLPEDDVLKPPRYGYELHRSGRQYGVTIYGELAEEKRWVRLTSLPIGRGKQTRARKVMGTLALPFAFAVDLVACSAIFLLLIGFEISNEP